MPYQRIERPVRSAHYANCAVLADKYGHFARLAARGSRLGGVQNAYGVFGKPAHAGLIGSRGFNKKSRPATRPPKPGFSRPSTSTTTPQAISTPPSMSFTEFNVKRPRIRLPAGTAPVKRSRLNP